MLFGDDTSLCHLHFRIHFPELILKPPMCGAFLSIEETGGCEQKGPDTKRGYFCSICILFHYPGNQVLVFVHRGLHVSKQSRNKNEVRFLYLDYLPICANR